MSASQTLTFSSTPAPLRLNSSSSSMDGSPMAPPERTQPACLSRGSFLGPLMVLVRALFLAGAVLATVQLLHVFVRRERQLRVERGLILLVVLLPALAAVHVLERLAALGLGTGRRAPIAHPDHSRLLPFYQ